MEVMPFGKHKGKPLDSVPLDYLEYCNKTMELREPLRSIVKELIGVGINDQEKDRLIVGISNFVYLLTPIQLMKYYRMMERDIGF